LAAHQLEAVLLERRVARAKRAQVLALADKTSDLLLELLHHRSAAHRVKSRADRL